MVCMCRVLGRFRVGTLGTLSWHSLLSHFALHQPWRLDRCNPFFIAIFHPSHARYQEWQLHSPGPSHHRCPASMHSKTSALQCPMLHAKPHLCQLQLIGNHTSPGPCLPPCTLLSRQHKAHGNFSPTGACMCRLHSTVWRTALLLRRRPALGRELRREAGPRRRREARTRGEPGGRKARRRHARAELQMQADTPLSGLPLLMVESPMQEEHHVDTCMLHVCLGGIITHTTGTP